jgi:nucleoside 2-deoxyribosyltransferase
VVKSVYVAGPLGFTLAGRQLLKDRIIPDLTKRGYDVLDPWEEGDRIFGAILDHQFETRDHDAVRERAARAGARNAEMIRESTAVLAIVDDCDLDSGTCAEIGYAAALPRPIVALRTDTRWCGDFPEIQINLQVAFFVEHSGGQLVLSLNAAYAALEGLTRDS